MGYIPIYIVLFSYLVLLEIIWVIYWDVVNGQSLEKSQTKDIFAAAYEIELRASISYGSMDRSKWKTIS